MTKNLRKRGIPELCKPKAGSHNSRRSWNSGELAVQLAQEIYGSRRQDTNGHDGGRAKSAPAGQCGIENGARHAKKSSGLLCEAPEVKFSFIFEHPEYPKAKWVVHMKVSRSGYYHWKRAHVQREKRKREYAERVRREFIAGEGHMVRAVYVEDSEQKASHAAFTEFAISWICKICVRFVARDVSDPFQIAGKRVAMVMLI